MVSKKALEDFKKVWEKDIGSTISDGIAIEEATALLTLFDVVYRPVKKEWIEEIDKPEDLS